MGSPYIKCTCYKIECQLSVSSVQGKPTHRRKPLVSGEKMPIFCEVTYYIEIIQFLVFATKPEVIFRILIRYFRDQCMTI